MSLGTRAFFTPPGNRPGELPAGAIPAKPGRESLQGIGGRSSKAVAGRQRGSESVRLKSSTAVKRSLRGTEVVRPGGSGPSSQHRPAEPTGQARPASRICLELLLAGGARDDLREKPGSNGVRLGWSFHPAGES